MRTAVVALVLVAGALPASTGAATGAATGGVTRASERAGGGYTTYVACSTRTSAKPAHSCTISEPKAAFFRSAKHDATYKVCVRFPGKKKRLCASAQEAGRGQTRVVTIATSKLGKHKVWWYVAGRQVGTWSFDVVADRAHDR
jgi:hypothetical protein